jgi:hypothetical protein
MSNQVVLQLDPSKRNARNSEGGFVTLKSGRILFAYTKYDADSEDDGAAVIASRYSDDGGKSWSKRDRVILHRRGAKNVMSVSLLRLQDGRVAFLFLRKEGVRTAQTCMPYIAFSGDECATFTEPIGIIAPPGYCVVNNDRLVQLASGRLVVPVGLHRMRGLSSPAKTSTPDTGWSPAAMIFYYLSDDGGAHWFESLTSNYAYFPNGQGMQEPGVVELKNGKLWGWARAGEFGIAGVKGRQWEMFSDDRGMTWTQAKPSKFISPCSPMSVKRIPRTGDLLAVWNDHSERFKVPKSKPSSWGRTPLVCAISKDEGKTWRHHQMLEKAPDHGFCYTAIHFTDDDAVLLAYCAGGASTKLVLDRLRMRRITVESLYR